MDNLILETKNLILKPIEMSDAEAVFHFFNENVTKYMYPSPAKTIQDTYQFINHSMSLREQDKEIVWVARLKYDDTFVGCFGLHRKDTKTPEVGLWIQEGLFGKKLGIEGMTEVINFTKEYVTFEYIIYPVDRRNISSRNIPETLGGILTKTYKKKTESGKELDTLEYRFFKEIPKGYHQPVILFQGDSITDCGRNRHDFHSLGDGYVKELKPYFPLAQIINRGISGDRTVELIARWKEDVISHHPDVLLLLCGVNDVWHHFRYGKPMNLEMFEKNYRLLLDKTMKESLQTKIILIEPFSYNIGAFEASWRPMLLGMIHIVRKLAKEFDLTLIQMDDFMQEWAKHYPQEAILGDGVHPTELGHQWMAKVIKPVLREEILKIEEKRINQS